MNYSHKFYKALLLTSNRFSLYLQYVYLFQGAFSQLWGVCYPTAYHPLVWGRNFAVSLWPCPLIRHVYAQCVQSPSACLQALEPSLPPRKNMVRGP